MTARVADVLGGAAVLVAPGDSLAGARAVMASRRVEHAAVVVDGRLLGLVAGSDVDAAHPSQATTLTAGEVRAALDVIPSRG